MIHVVLNSYLMFSYIIAMTNSPSMNDLIIIFSRAQSRLHDRVGPSATCFDNNRRTLSKHMHKWNLHNMLVHVSEKLQNIDKLRSENH